MLGSPVETDTTTGIVMKWFRFYLMCIFFVAPAHSSSLSAIKNRIKHTYTWLKHKCFPTASDNFFSAIEATEKLDATEIERLLDSSPGLPQQTSGLACGALIDLCSITQLTQDHIRCIKKLLRQGTSANTAMTRFSPHQKPSALLPLSALIQKNPVLDSNAQTIANLLFEAGANANIPYAPTQFRPMFETPFSVALVHADDAWLNFLMRWGAEQPMLNSCNTAMNDKLKQALAKYAPEVNTIYMRASGHPKELARLIFSYLWQEDMPTAQTKVAEKQNSSTTST